MKVIRIEYSDGNGIFRARNSNKNKVIEALPNYKEFVEFHKKFPNPLNSNESVELYENFIPLYHFCAFKDRAQMNNWLSAEHLQNVLKLGFKIYEIDVKTALMGNHQVAYKKRDIVNIIDITNEFI